LGIAVAAIGTVGYLAVGEPLPLPLAGTRSDASAREAFAAGDVAANERMLPVEVSAVEWATGFEVADRFLGQVEVARASDLGFELSGKLGPVLVEEGEYVREGQVLARLDTDRLQAREAELEAAVDQAEAARELAETTWDRIRRLVEKRAASQQDLDDATEQKKRANAGLRQARAQLKAVRVDLAKSKLVAPFDGAIGARYTDEGSMLSMGQPVVRVMETGRHEVRVGLPSELARKLEMGTSLPLRSRDGNGGDAPAWQGQGRVERILPMRDGRLQTVDVILAPDAAISQEVRDGDLVEIGISRRIESPGFWLPRASLTESARGLWAVYAAVPSDDARDARRLETRQVEIVEQSGGCVFVRGALQSGDLVVVSGRQRLTPGIHVAPVEAPASELLAGQ
jgi:RND family efflux transporter MFP subunit